MPEVSSEMPPEVRQVGHYQRRHAAGNQRPFAGVRAYGHALISSPTARSMDDEMNTDPARIRVRSSSPGAAERMRLHRKRRREGTHSVRVQLDPPDIDGLIRLKLLRQSERNSNAALQVAVAAG